MSEEERPRRLLGTYEVQHSSGKLKYGWHLERYTFMKYSCKDYEVFIQAGDRVAGGSRQYAIPSSLFEGTYEEFVDAYVDVLPPALFGVGKEDLLPDIGLKAFLGFVPRKKHPEVTVVKLPEFALVGNSVLCCGDKDLPLKVNCVEAERDEVPKLIRKTAKRYDELVELGKKPQAEDAPKIMWGIMSDNMSYEKLSPWVDFYRSGEYFAGVEADVAFCKAGKWERTFHKQVIPASTYFVAEVTEDNYEEVYWHYINEVIPEMGMRLKAVCERIELTKSKKQKKLTLYFAVSKLK